VFNRSQVFAAFVALATLAAPILPAQDASARTVQYHSADIVPTRAREDLSRAQQDRQGALYRVATLEAEVTDLHKDLETANSEAGSSEKYLTADRDIRELMGARQLYIADVFDVQDNGERSKPFGRVFYTKGRSLIFYAFDLQKQPGYHEAKAFQAWGKPDSGSAKPVSLGIFYEDSDENRRWVVKSDNPELLAEINAVFVTVEPKGGSQKPTGKPFLEAYLHSLPPNHP
jgi:Anti-sigma-K factor rskA